MLRQYLKLERCPLYRQRLLELEGVVRLKLQLSRWLYQLEIDKPFCGSANVFFGNLCCSKKQAYMPSIEAEQQA
ncbi:MAG: hypothetical protein SP1CHLAM54_17070 [Chlamydiia bacterium]|nr:hypothetical protein [Chlamydiia bacterium]MCH9616595.1 hypothetical protein [Chlamydiia bacterium]